jgi:hypothetical protein
MIKLKDILNESMWEGKSVGVKYIVNNALRYMNDEVKQTVKEILPKISDITNIARQLNSNRQKIADIMTKQGFSGDPISDYDQNIKPIDLKIYKNAAKIIYNNSSTQTLINNTITEVINNLSTKQFISIKGIWMFQSEVTLKEKISKAIQKIAHMDMFKIQNPETRSYSSMLNKTFIKFQTKDQPIFNDIILVDSIYNTINKLL